jgi:hypothetical protein
MRLFYSIGFVLLFLNSSAQTTNNQEKIKNLIENYFQYDREIIHVHFNKNIYVNFEDLAFKGYVFSKNNSTPNINTTNVELVIYNDNNEIIQKQLLYTSKGIFAGGIHLNDKFKTGKYYFHFYTNWMNNFKEDDSFVQTIEIIDKTEKYNFKSNEPIWKTAKLTLFPEGGSIINSINNTIGVAIKDCNNKGIEIKKGIILDSKLNEVSHFFTNKMGNGVFYLIPDPNETYTLKIESDQLSISQPLPIVKETGIIITYNDKLSNNKLLVTVKTNEKGVELFQNKKYILLIQQNKKFIQKEITFDNKEQEQSLLLDKKYLSSGVNSIRIIDEDLNEVTEKLIFIYPQSTSTTSLKAKFIANDSISLIGNSAINKANLSISVLPEKNACVSQKRSLQGTFYLNAYLQNPEIDNYAYFDYENKDRMQDMELLMLNQNKSKFLWNTIKSNPPKINYSFEKGVTISGKVDKKINPNLNYKISLISIINKVFDEAPIDGNNNFKFDNFFAQDSTMFVLQMVNKRNVTLNTKIESSVSQHHNAFILPLQFDKIICPLEQKKDTSFVFSSSKFDDKTIKLGEVVIKNNFKKEVLIHKSEMSSFASSFKIKEGEFGKVLDFIGSNGYRTGMDPETSEVFIKSRKSAFLGDSAKSPSVYVDNELLFDFNLLFDLLLSDVDEIYIDSSGSSDTSSQGMGTIKIFLKDQSLRKDYFKIKYSTLIVTNGFAKNITFKNSQFETQNEFYSFGTMNWKPNIRIESNENFEIKFPKENQKEIQVLLEGFSEDGQLVSEMKKIPIMNFQ